MIAKYQLDRKKHLIDIAAGRVAADLLFVNCRIVDVYSQKIVNGPLAVAGGQVVGIGEYEAVRILDMGGRYLLPGLIDAHAHIESSMMVPPHFARAVAASGTTVVIADPHEIANVLGIEGIRFMLDNSRNLPICIKYMLPSCVPASEFEYSGAYLTAEDLIDLLDEKQVLGIGEVMNFPGVVTNDEALLRKIMAAEAKGKIVDGHAPGISGHALSAYAAAGIRTDHECVAPAELQERVGCGMYVHIREGTAAQNLVALVQGLTPGMSRRCTFCTDDREAHDIVHRGHVNSLLKLAVSQGIDPVIAVTMATLNPAECYGLAGKGALAPGRDADIVVVDDLVGFKVREVFTSGRQIVKNGELVWPHAMDSCSDFTNTVHLGAISDDAFRLPLTGSKVRAISVVPHSLVTKKKLVNVVPDDNGCFQSASSQDLVKIAVVERHKGSGKVGVGVLHGLGLHGGAIATTVAHDAHNIVVAGDNDRDMLLAVRKIAEAGGGIILVKNGDILGKLDLPVAGLMCERPAADVSRDLEALTVLAHRELQIDPQLEPFMSLSFMSLSVIPELKITAAGLLDVESMSLIPVSA